MAQKSSKPQTKIATLLKQYRADATKMAPVTMRDYMIRMQELPRLAAGHAPSNGFARPADLAPMHLRLVTGFFSSRFQMKSLEEQIDDRVTLGREMLLLTYEAKPRPISFAMTGYTASDFIAYIYQDVALRSMGRNADVTHEEFVAQIDDIKSWLRLPPPSRIDNSPRRHIRRRLMLLLDRTNNQAASLLEDREMPNELVLLAQKLLECDDDEGYTQGRLRDFREVREDFNVLAEHCVRLRHPDDSKLLSSFDRVICPSLVDDFASYQIDLPRGRYINGQLHVVNKDKTKKARKTPSKLKKDVNPDEVLKLLDI